ncbi:MAG: J domain-containing protein [Thalassobaculaceae bacterium]
MTYLILGLGLVIGAILTVRWFAAAPPQQILRGLKWFALAVLAGGAIFIAISRRFDILGYLFAVVLPFLLRWGGLIGRLSNMARTAAGPRPGQSSEIRTRLLLMRLDHDSGQLSGEVLDGPYRGRELTSLTLDEALALLTQCRQEDPQGAQALETFLDRQHGDDWRRQGDADGGPGDRHGGGRSPGGDNAEMNADQARAVLGVAAGASAAEIREAHRRLMKVAHPDRGGSDYLATQINRAKDVLLDT